MMLKCIVAGPGMKSQNLFYNPVYLTTLSRQDKQIKLHLVT